MSVPVPRPGGHVWSSGFQGWKQKKEKLGEAGCMPGCLPFRESSCSQGLSPGLLLLEVAWTLTFGHSGTILFNPEHGTLSHDA